MFQSNGLADNQPGVEAIVDQLLRDVGLSSTGSTLDVIGADPIVPSVHRLGAGTTAVLAAQALAVCEIWKARSGRDQKVSVDMRHALHSLRSVYANKVNGHAADYRTHLGPIGGFLGRTRDDRWIFLIGSYPHFKDRYLELLNCWNRAESIGAAVAKWDAFELEDAASALKLPAAVVRTVDEWREHPQGQWLAQVPVVEVTKIGDSEPRPFLPAARPLSDIRVLDMTHVLAGPSVARLLAEQGADVLHLQSSTSPDLPALNLDANIGKRSAFCDFGNEEDERRLQQLLLDADLFVESYRYGSLYKHGLSPEELAARNPGIIHVYANCYGAGGPWAARGGFDQLGQCVTGIAATEGSISAPQLVPTYLLNDYLAGYFGALGAMAALIRRSKEGGSYSVKVSLTRCSTWIQGLGLLPGSARQVPDTMGPAPTRFTQTPFGTLEHLRPVVQFSETPAYWELPVVPWGASLPRWASIET